MPERRLIHPEVTEYLKRRPGIPVHIGKIAEDLRLKVQSVSNALANQAEANSGIKRIRRGVYYFDPNFRVASTGDPIPTILEVIGRNLADNGWIARDENGILYEVTKR